MMVKTIAQLEAEKEQYLQRGLAELDATLRNLNIDNVVANFQLGEESVLKIRIRCNIPEENCDFQWNVESIPIFQELEAAGYCLVFAIPHDVARKCNLPNKKGYTMFKLYNLFHRVPIERVSLAVCVGKTPQDIKQCPIFSKDIEWTYMSPMTGVCKCSRPAVCSARLEKKIALLCESCLKTTDTLFCSKIKTSQ